MASEVWGNMREASRVVDKEVVWQGLSNSVLPEGWWWHNGNLLLLLFFFLIKRLGNVRHKKRSVYVTKSV